MLTSFTHFPHRRMLAPFVQKSLQAVLCAWFVVSHAQAQVNAATGTKNPRIAYEPQSALTSQSGLDLPSLEAYPEVRDLLAQGKPASALAVLQGHQKEHENDADYFNLIGIIALKAGDYAAAAPALERVVLMQPDNAGAWLDLAIATTEMGHLSSAASYFDHIEAEFAPPPALRRVITHYRARIAAQSSPLPSWNFSADATLGTDSNANSGLQNSVLPLTLGVERIDLILDPAYQARRDNYAQYGLAAHYSEHFGLNRLGVIVGARERRYHHEHDFSTLNLSLGAGLQRPTLIGDASLWVHLEHLVLGGSSLLRNVRMVGQIERPYGTCRVGVSGEVEWRRYLASSTLDANLVWGQAGVACDWQLAQIITQATLIGRIGIDSPAANRAGGQTRRTELIAQLAAPLAWGARAELTVALATAYDADGYSALLENNARRRLDRRNVRFVLSAPLNISTDLLFAVEENRFTSNISLFQQSGKSISTSIRRRF